MALALAAPTAAQGVVVDPLTGVAIDGYDPVTYFTRDAPQPGLPQFEYEWQGVPWYFVSAANRDVFARNPDVYAPQYGGHGAIELARGHLSEGRPTIYLIEGDRVYLFYSAGNREAFRLSLPKVRDDAEAAWARLAPKPEAR